MNYCRSFQCFVIVQQWPAKGVAQERLISDAFWEEFHKKRFESIYMIKLTSRRLLVQTLLGRIQREYDQGAHTLLAVSRVKMQSQVTQTAPGKQFKMGDATLSIGPHTAEEAQDIANFPRYFRQTRYDKR